MNGAPSVSFNPNPITKFIVTMLVSFTVLHPIGFFAWGVMVWISLFFWLRGSKKEALRSFLVFALLYFLPNFEGAMALPGFLKMFVALLVVVKMFYLPFMAGKYLIQTSDVGDIITSMDAVHVPRAIAIPVAVMFRFFPSFKEEHHHIKQAMKIRGITWKNPLRYGEYVSIPLLILSSTIADDIAMAAETRGIGIEGEKTRFREVKRGVVDLVYFLGVFGFVLGGWLCLR